MFFPIAFEVLNEERGLSGGFDSCVLKLLVGKNLRRGGNHKAIRGVGARIIARALDRFVQAIDHIGIDPERFFQSAKGQFGFPDPIDLLGGRVIPEAVFRVVEIIFGPNHLAFPGVINLDAQNRLRGVRPDAELGHAVARFQIQLGPRRLRNDTLPFQIAIHPDLGGDFVFGGILVVVVRRDGESPLAGLEFMQRGGQVVDEPVKIIRGAEKENRAGNVFEIVIVGDRRHVERAGVLPVADAAAGGSDGLHAVIASGREHGDFSTHRVAVNAESVGIHFRLLFEKGQRAPSGKGAQEPRAVPWRLDRIEGPFRGFDTCEVAGGVSSWGVVGIHRAPIGGDLVVRVVFFALPEKFHALGIHMVVRRGDPSRPCDRDRSIAALGIGQDLFVLSELSPAMNLHQPGKFAGALGISVDRSHHGFLAFEDADTIPQHLQNNAVLFPLFQDFNIQRLRPHIDAGPECLPRLRSVAR